MDVNRTPMFIADQIEPGKNDCISMEYAFGAVDNLTRVVDHSTAPLTGPEVRDVIFAYNAH